VENADTYKYIDVDFSSSRGLLVLSVLFLGSYSCSGNCNGGTWIVLSQTVLGLGGASLVLRSMVFPLSRLTSRTFGNFRRWIQHFFLIGVHASRSVFRFYRTSAPCVSLGVHVFKFSNRSEHWARPNPDIVEQPIKPITYNEPMWHEFTMRFDKSSIHAHATTMRLI
jgi:hypothetical protein